MNRHKAEWSVMGLEPTGSLPEQYRKDKETIKRIVCRQAETIASLGGVKYVASILMQIDKEMKEENQ